MAPSILYRSLCWQSADEESHDFLLIRKDEDKAGEAHHSTADSNSPIWGTRNLGHLAAASAPGFAGKIVRPLPSSKLPPTGGQRIYDRGSCQFPEEDFHA